MQNYVHCFDWKGTLMSKIKHTKKTINSIELKNKNLDLHNLIAFYFSIVKWENCGKLE